MSEILKTNTAYSEWIREVSLRFRQSQIKAATKVNKEMLIFYWSIGHDISVNHNENVYGKSFFKNLSLDLQDALPDVKSFSVTNLKYMKYFCEMYVDSNRQQLVDDSFEETYRYAIDDCIFMIPWGHNIQIMNKCKGNIDKALFFVKKTYENNWSRNVLLNFLDTGLYERDGKAINNFDKLLPDVGSDLAREITKDPYNFDFLTLREGYDEKELKDALMNNIQKFLLELGKGFAFVGREYRLVVGETEQFIDMLFYNIHKHCYVVIEIKTRAFNPGDMGQLGTYIAAANGILCGKETNPGILKLPIEDIFRGGNSKPRNPHMQTMLRMVGFGDNAGSGFPTILAAWASEGWMKPELIENTELNQVSLILRMLKSENENVIENVIEISEKWIQKKMPEYSKKKIQTVLEIISLISDNHIISISEMVKTLGISDRTIARYISELKENMIIERVGPDNGGYWKINFS